MALSGFILTTLLSTFGPAVPTLACSFPDRAQQTPPITLLVEHNPSLFDLGENYQVHLSLGKLGQFDAAAAPERRSAEWDVVIRGIQNDRQLAVALRADGTAIMRLVSDGAAQKQTRLGHCQGYETYLRRWTS